MITKTLIVVNGMSGRETPVRVREGAAPADILSRLGLKKYQLARAKDSRLIRTGHDLSRLVQNGERVFAFAPIKYGDRL